MNPFRTHGAISWSEYLSPDVDRSLTFFRNLVGWSASAMPMEDGPYYVLQIGNTSAAGVMACPPGVPPCWCFYVTLHDIRAWLETKRPKVMVPLTETPIGPFAGITDPQGAYLNVMQYHDTEDSSGLDSVMTAYLHQGHFAWFELQTTDPAAAAEYYCDLFGWTIDEQPIPSGTYHRIAVDGAAIGGIMASVAPDVPPHWSGYVTVEDVDAIQAKAQSLGATITAPAFEVPEVGRLMHLLDPDGVPLAFATWNLPGLGT
ncbi:MAG: VOC family protein [Bacteroidota bacterium]|nr:VOC family protein [Bacteroidota bacterium]MDE2955669.1 VOC family protein [Bacteroidota bacterium]